MDGLAIASLKGDFVNKLRKTDEHETWMKLKLLLK